MQLDTLHDFMHQQGLSSGKALLCDQSRHVVTGGKNLTDDPLVLHVLDRGLDYYCAVCSDASMHLLRQ